MNKLSSTCCVILSLEQLWEIGVIVSILQVTKLKLDDLSNSPKGPQGSLDLLWELAMGVWLKPFPGGGARRWVGAGARDSAFGLWPHGSV